MSADIDRCEQPMNDEDLRKLKAALRDIENGDRGIPFEDHIREVKAKLKALLDE